MRSSSAVGRTAAPTTVRPYLLGCLAAFSVGAAAIHFAVVFEHFAEYALYGVFFLMISWAQVIWPAVLLWRPSRLWLWLGAQLALKALGLGADHCEYLLVGVND